MVPGKWCDIWFYASISNLWHRRVSENYWEFIKCLWIPMVFPRRLIMARVKWRIYDVFTLVFLVSTWNHILQFVLTLIVRSCFIVHANTSQETLANSKAVLALFFVHGNLEFQTFISICSVDNICVFKIGFLIDGDAFPRPTGKLPLLWSGGKLLNRGRFFNCDSWGCFVKHNYLCTY